MLRFEWLTFCYLALLLSREFGIPPRVGQAICFVLLLLMLLVLLGVLR